MQPARPTSIVDTNPIHIHLQPAIHTTATHAPHTGGPTAVGEIEMVRGVGGLVVRGGLERDVFGVQRGVGLAEHVVALLGVVEHLLEVFDALVFALAVGALRGAVLGSSSLQKECVLV